MISYDTSFYTSDIHSVIDKNTGKRLNHAKSIKLGNRVWAGHKSTFLKGSEISDNSIVGALSLVTKPFTEPDTLIAGLPSRKVRQGVSWDRSLL